MTKEELIRGIEKVNLESKIYSEEGKENIERILKKVRIGQIFMVNMYDCDGANYHGLTDGWTPYVKLGEKLFAPVTIDGKLFTPNTFATWDNLCNCMNEDLLGTVPFDENFTEKFIFEGIGTFHEQGGKKCYVSDGQDF